MVRPIVKDVLFLMKPSAPATRADLSLARELRDTLAFHREGCVGMAANMIGISKRVIIISVGTADIVMFNPVVLSRSQPYEAQEGCLSLEGTRKALRYQRLEIEYRDEGWKKKKVNLTGWTAQICQHELDHLEGIII